MIRPVRSTSRWSNFTFLSGARWFRLQQLSLVLPLGLALLALSSLAQAQTACSKSEALYNAANLANIKIFGKYVTLPPEPEWEGLVPLYNQLKDHDTSVHLGECKAMMVVLKQKIVERVKKYGTTLSVSLDDPLNRLQGNGRISLDGTLVRADPDSPIVILPGTHRIALRGVALQPGERLALTTELDGTTSSKGEASELDIEIPRTSEGGTRHHTLTFRIGAQHECRVRLNVSGNLLNRPKPGQPSFIVELSNQKLFTRQLLQKGDYPLTEGTYALTIKLNEGTLPDRVQPRLLVDDAQIGLKRVYRDELPTWQHLLRIGCEPGSSIGQYKINIGFSGEGGKPLLEADPDTVIKEPEADEPSAPIPAWTWVGIGAFGVGTAVAIVSHFAIANPAEEAGNAVYEDEQCATVSCGPEIEDYVYGQYDKRDLANGVALGGVVLAGVGAIVGTVAWFTREPSKPDGENTGLSLAVVPFLSAKAGGATLRGTF